MKLDKFILLFVFICPTLFFSCVRITVKKNYESIDSKDSIDSTFSKNTTKDSITFYFWTAYRSDRVKVFQNGKLIYNQKLNSYNEPCAGWFTFKKEKKNNIQIQINWRKTNEFILDSKYRNAIIYWDSYMSEINIEYGNREPFFD
jgi:hypothetical protein